MKHANRRRQRILILTAVLLMLSTLVGCGALTGKEASYAPQVGDDWPVSTPREQGLSPARVAKLYRQAAKLDNLYGLLLVKNGQLVTEEYYNVGAMREKALLQSATKSYTSALVGVALEQGCLTSLDQKMIDFFPELADEPMDPRKAEITIRQMLQMRSGYVWEERDLEYLRKLYLSNEWLPFLSAFPLGDDPGAAFRYSHLTSHLLGVIVSRACDTDILSYGETHLFAPLGVEAGDWLADADGYRFGQGELHVTARDAAKFGQLYLNEGQWQGEQVLSADWVRASLDSYSDEIQANSIGEYFGGVGYGYQWWSALSGDHQVHLAWGEGGNLIVLIPDQEMVIVTIADPQYQKFGKLSWQEEQEVIDLVGEFIASLPSN